MLTKIDKAIADRLTPFVMNKVVKVIDPANPPENFKEGKVLVVIGGGRGVGKSGIRERVIEMLQEDGYKREYIAELGSYIFDSILSKPGIRSVRNIMDDYAKGVATGKEDSALTRIGNEVFARVRDKAFKQGSPLVVDYHMDDPVLVRKLVDEARQHGYETVFVSASVTLKIAEQRMKEREQLTGRKTNIAAGLKTHQDFAMELPGYFDLFDAGLHFDTLQEAPRLIVHSLHGKVTVRDGEAYDQLRQVGKNQEAANAPYKEADTGSGLDTERGLADAARAGGKNRGESHGQGRFTARLMQGLASHDLKPGPTK